MLLCRSVPSQSAWAKVRCVMVVVEDEVEVSHERTSKKVWAPLAFIFTFAATMAKMAS